MFFNDTWDVMQRVEDVFDKEPKVCIQLSSSIHPESRDEIR